MDQIEFARQMSEGLLANNVTARLEALLAKITSSDEYEKSLKWLSKVKGESNPSHMFIF